LPDAAQGLRLQDIALSPDMIVLALPDMAGLDRFVVGLLAAAALAVAIATANGPLSAIVRALGHDSPPNAGGERRNSRLASYAVAALALAAATGAALARPLSILDAAAYAFIIAAVALFPALFAALWWSRANSYGAAAAMLTGLTLALVYLVGTHYFAVPFYEWTAPLSNAGGEGLAAFAELKDAWLAAEPGIAKEATWVALQAQAGDNANWWGVEGLAVALLVLPVGFVALVVVSLVTPAPRPVETAP
jgi:cation/acetate symporter